MNNEIENIEKKKPENEKPKERDYKKEIEENVLIYDMPKNVETVNKGKKVESGFASHEQLELKRETSSTELIGFAIIFSGLFVLIGGSYLGYSYLIKPYTENDTKLIVEDKKVDDKQTSEDVDKNSKKDEKNNDKKEDKDLEKKDDAKDNDDAKDDDELVKNNGSDIEIAISTSSDSTSTTSEPVATSTDIADLPDLIDDYRNDLDGDGLYSVEEILLGANSDSADSDGDGYEDLEEVLALYDPMSTGKITDNENIDIYNNNVQNYSVFYPKNWKVTALDESRTIMFLAPNKAYISVIVQKNLTEKSVEDWYRDQFSNSDLDVLESIEGDAWHGVRNADGTIFYIASADMENIYTLSFIKNLNASNINYTNILRMMVNSFGLIEE